MVVDLTNFGGAMDFHFATAWETVADLYPNRTAAICDGHAVSWRDFEQRAARIAGLLQAHGLGANSKAGMYLHNSNEYQEANLVSSRSAAARST